MQEVAKYWRFVAVLSLGFALLAGAAELRCPLCCAAEQEANQRAEQPGAAQIVSAAELNGCADAGCCLSSTSNRRDSGISHHGVPLIAQQPFDVAVSPPKFLSQTVESKATVLAWHPSVVLRN